MRRTPQVFLDRGNSKIAPGGIEFIFETVYEKKEICEIEKASFRHSTRRSARGTDFVDILKT